MLAREILYSARALIDDYNTNGIPNAESDTIEIDTNGIRFINMALGEIYADSRVYNTFKITRKPIENLLGGYSNFNVLEYTGEDKELEARKGKAYHFSVDNDATVYVEINNGTWNTLETLTLTPTELTSYKGLIDNPLNLPVRLRFSGSTYYRYTNVAIFEYPFKANSIPDYAAWVKYDLPTDFGMIKKVVSEYPERQYVSETHYKLEGWKDFYVNYFFNGQMRVIYSPKPTVIATLDDNVEVNNPIVEQFVIYYVAASVALTEDPALANTFLQKSNELKFNAQRGQPSSEQKITDVYLGG